MQPLLNKIGRGWTSTLVSAVWFLMSSFWWSVMRWGPQWRATRREKDNAKQNNKREAREKDRDIEQANDSERVIEEDAEQNTIVEDRREDSVHDGQRSAFSTTARGA